MNRRKFLELLGLGAITIPFTASLLKPSEWWYSHAQPTINKPTSFIRGDGKWMTPDHVNAIVKDVNEYHVSSLDF